MNDQARPSGDAAWWERYERTLSTQGQQIAALSKDVSSLTADVRTLMRNQEQLFSRSSRPFQWGAFVSALGLVGVAATLLITPINSRLHTAEDFDREVMKYMLGNEHQKGLDEGNTNWLMKMEERHSSAETEEHFIIHQRENEG